MKIKAFTLAEVLLTLVIIGVIAAITIPTVHNSTNRLQYKSGLKKAISTICYAIDKNWAFTNKSVTDYNTEQELFDEIFNKYLAIFDMPSEFTTDVCNGLIFRTNDGVIYCLQNFYSSGSGDPDASCSENNMVPCVNSDTANLWIDVNGIKGPNKITESSDMPSDIYPAQIYSRKVVPYGDAAYEVMFN